MRKYLYLCLIAAMTVAGGCKKRSGLATYPVSGTVTYQGKAVAGASVSFSTNNPDAPKAGGFTDSEGRYSLSTYLSPTEILDGAAPGDYEVAIAKENAAIDAQGTDQMNSAGVDHQEMMRKMWSKQFQKTTGNNGQPVKPKPPIPERYSKTATSGLKATVRTSPNTSVDFKLTDD